MSASKVLTIYLMSLIPKGCGFSGSSGHCGILQMLSSQRRNAIYDGFWSPGVPSEIRQSVSTVIFLGCYFLGTDAML